MSEVLHNADDNYGKAWYSLDGLDNDVIVSSMVRLSRNLANFPFPSCFKNDDRERVRSIIMDAFGKIEKAEELHSIQTKDLTPMNRKVLEERGVLKSLEEIKARKISVESEAILNHDGNISSVINSTDHLKMTSFASGLAIRDCYKNVSNLDKMLQKHLQFASSYDFGYLTSTMKDLGSGMKISCRLALPASLKSGKIQEVYNLLKGKNAVMLPAFPNLSKGNIPPAGSYFLICNNSSFNGSEIDQIAEMESVCKLITEYERKILGEFADNHMTVIRNSVLRFYSLATMSLLVTLREAIDIISEMQLALRLNLIEGIDNNCLCSLLYRVQDGHLSYLKENGDFQFEDDVKNENRLELDRLRAVILQEAFENISLRKL